MEDQRILLEVLNAEKHSEMQKALWICEIHLVLVVDIYGPKKDFSSFFSQLSPLLCMPLDNDHIETRYLCLFQLRVRMLNFFPDSF